MKITVKSGDTVIEYEEATEATKYPHLTYNSGKNGINDFQINELIINTIKEMCDMCVLIERDKYQN